MASFSKVSPQGTGSIDGRIRSLADVLAEEFGALHSEAEDVVAATTGAAPAASRTSSTRAEIYDRIHRARHAALCLSGGGIRSATFNLGVLQALARLGLLERFHYLSTVSGGGYIGGWLSAWASRDAAGVAGVSQKLLLTPMSDMDQTTARPPEAPAIRWLRTYSNYLSPRLGLLAADTWTLVATYIRNLLLNWLVFLPLIAAALMLPRFGVCAMIWIGEDHEIAGGNYRATQVAIGLLVLGGICQAVAVAYMDASRPSAHSGATQDKTNNQRRFLRWALLPMLLAGMFVTSAWVGIRPAIEGFGQFLVFGLVVGVSLLFSAIGIGFGWLYTEKLGRPMRLRGAIPQLVAAILSGTLLWFFGTRRWLDPRYHPIEYVALSIPLFLVSFLLAGVLLRGLTTAYTADEDREWSARSAGWLLIALVAWLGAGLVVLFGPSLMIMLSTWLRASVAAAGGIAAVATALLGRSAGTPGTPAHSESLSLPARLRQWGLALAAPVFIVVLLVALVFGTDRVVATLVPTDQLVVRCNDAHQRPATPGPAVATTHPATHPAVATLRPPQPATRETHDFRGLRDANAMVRQEPVRFSVARQSSPPGIDMNRTTAMINASLPDTVPVDVPASSQAVEQPVLCAYDWHQQVLLSADGWNLILWLVALSGVGLVMNYFVSINRYSLNAVYRNRIVRAYLGASREDRENSPTLNPFTGFDEQDNPPICEVQPAFGTPGAIQPWRLFHIVNVTLNLVAGHELAWQERKAANFTISPLHCGSAGLGYRDSRLYGGAGNKGSQRQPVTLGTAVAISGAAASPNMGYHTSSALAFVMTLLNVRLGAWLGNPKCEHTYAKSQPAFSAVPLFAEALGLTDDDSPYVYLSDGGHFENLGLYEMVRRRCKYIVVIDAGSDADCEFGDLGNALRKIYIDMGIRIDFPEPLRIRSRRKLDPDIAADSRYCGVGYIHYDEVDEIPQGMNPSDLVGMLLYIKPAIYETGEPLDVINYARRCDVFPHETTADQFFSESQFESYRKLGSYIMSKIGENVPAGGDIETLMVSARDQRETRQETGSESGRTNGHADDRSDGGREPRKKKPRKSR